MKRTLSLFLSVLLVLSCVVFVPLVSTAASASIAVDFESALSVYTDWTFANVTKSSGTISAHGGSSYATTSGKTTASMVTNSKISNPESLTFYVSKESNNTKTSTWYAEVSTDGSSWTQVASQSASSMNKGVWIEVSADLTSYSDVYIRIRYDGTAAIRDIDDVTVVYGLDDSECAHESLTETPAVDATCVSAGNIAYWTCDDCGKFFSNSDASTEIEEGSWVVPATGNHVDSNDDGLCDVCGYVFDRATLSFSVNGTVDDDLEITGNVGTSVTLPTPDVTELTYDDNTYTFVGWAVLSADIDEPTTTAPTVFAGSYEITADADFYAVYKYGVGSDSYTLVNSTDDLVIGAEVIIVSSTTADSLSTTQNTNNRGVAAGTKGDTTYTPADNTAILTLREGTVTGTYSFFDSVNNGYLYAASSSSNWLRTEEALDDNGSFTISFSGNNATVTAQGTNTRKILRYNSQNIIFACYASGQIAVCIYQKIPGTTKYLTLSSGHVHTWEEVSRTPATCEEDGEINYECSCGETKTETIPANGHTWNDGVITVAPTCINAGVKTFTCTVCNATKTEEVPATGVHIDEDEDDLCDLCDNKLTFSLGTALYDGDKVVIVYVADNLALTTVASGTKLSGAAVVPENGEITVTNATVAFLTVEYDGEPNFFLKTEDGKYLTSGATGNSLTFTDTANEYSLWYVEEIDDSTVYVHSVNAEYNGGSQSLEYFNGFTTYGTKTTANYVFSLYTQHEHVWDAGTVTTPATCGDEGVKTFTCALCGEIKTETIPVTGEHTFGDWSYAGAVTFTSGTTKTRTCSVCGETEEVDVAPAELGLYENVIQTVKDSKNCVAVVTTIKAENLDFDCIDYVGVTLQFSQGDEVVKTVTQKVHNIYTTVTGIATTSEATSASQGSAYIEGVDYLFAINLKGIPEGDYTLTATVEAIDGGSAIEGTTLTETYNFTVA